MKITNLPSPSERLEHYKLTIEALRENKGDDYYGLCIVMGDIVYDDFVKYAPWECFEDLQRYYPELTEPASWIHYHFEEDRVKEALTAIQERIVILEKAIEQVLNASANEA